MWTPRYKLYARHHCMTCEQVHARDCGLWKFNFWLYENWKLYKLSYGIKGGEAEPPEEYKQFDTWLENKVVNSG